MYFSSCFNECTTFLTKILFATNGPSRFVNSMRDPNNWSPTCHEFPWMKPNNRRTFSYDRTFLWTFSLSSFVVWKVRELSWKNEYFLWKFQLTKFEELYYVLIATNLSLEKIIKPSYSIHIVTLRCDKLQGERSSKRRKFPTWLFFQ